jgi:hypothetical protein
MLWHASIWAVALFLCFSGAGLARTLRPLHENRAGHHAAGRWLAQNIQPADVVHDDHCWAHFYAGRMLQEFADPPRWSKRLRHFVVISRVSERRPSTNVRQITEQEAQDRGGKVVFHWPEQSSLARARVLIYELPAP